MVVACGRRARRHRRGAAVRERVYVSPRRGYLCAKLQKCSRAQNCSNVVMRERPMQGGSSCLSTERPVAPRRPERDLFLNEERRPRARGMLRWRQPLVARRAARIPVPESSRSPPNQRAPRIHPAQSARALTTRCRGKLRRRACYGTFSMHFRGSAVRSWMCLERRPIAVSIPAESGG